MLVSDGIFAHDLCVKGYMDHVIREAIRFGIDAKDAIRMVTLNPARYFRLDGEIGSITPGRIADILLLEHIENPTPVCVVERGRVAAEKGILTAPGAPFPDVGNRYNPYSFKTVEASDFIIEWKGEEQIPVIDIVDRTVTKRLDISPYRDGSRLLPLRDKDIIKACYTRREKKLWGKGFVRGIGVNLGGMALTMAHETHGLLVIGYDDNDMALAANTVLAIDGGVVMVDRGEVLYRFPLPEGGTMSRLAIPALAEELKKVTALLNKRGSALTEPLLTIGFLTLTSIVALRLTVSGIYDVKAGGIIF
jgi:adenine deaminase